MRKPDFCICKNKAAVTAQLISAFVFATRVVQFLFFLNPKFQACSHLLWLHRLVCVRPGWKPRRPVFSRCSSFDSHHRKNFLARSDPIWAIEPHDMARGLKFCKKKGGGLYYLCREYLGDYLGDYMHMQFYGS